MFESYSDFMSNALLYVFWEGKTLWQYPHQFNLHDGNGIWTNQNINLDVRAMAREKKSTFYLDRITARCVKPCFTVSIDASLTTTCEQASSAGRDE